MNFLVSFAFIIQYGLANPTILNDCTDISGKDNLYLRLAIQDGNLDSVKYILNHAHFKHTPGIYHVINDFCDELSNNHNFFDIFIIGLLLLLAFTFFRKYFTK